MRALADAPGTGAPSGHPPERLSPAAYRIVDRRRETYDVVTLSLEPVEASPSPFPRAGSSTWSRPSASARSAISISSAPGAEGPSSTPCATSGRSPTPCGVAGGRGGRRARPLRDRLAARRPRRADPSSSPAASGSPPCVARSRDLVGRRPAAAGRLFVLVGARSPDQIVFGDELDRWRQLGADVRVTVDSATPEWNGSVGVVTSLLDGDALRPRADRGARVRTRDHDALHRQGARRTGGSSPEQIRVSLERNMQCGVGLVRPLPARPAAAVPRRPGRALRGRRRRAAARARAMTSPTATGPDGAGRALEPDGRRGADAGGLEVRLLRRLPAQPARLRGRAARPRRRRPHRELHRDVARDGRRPLRRLARRGLDHHAGRRRTHPRGARRLAAPDHHRRLRDRRRHPGLRNFAAAGDYRDTVYAHPEYLGRLGTSTPIAAHVPVDYELHGCPVDRGQLLEVMLAVRSPAGARRSPATASAKSARREAPSASSSPAATACLGPVTRAGLRRPLPVGRPRLLRLLRAGRDGQHPVARRRGSARAARRRATSPGSSGPSTRRTRLRGCRRRRARRGRGGQHAEEATRP